MIVLWAIRVELSSLLAPVVLMTEVRRLGGMSRASGSIILYIYKSISWEGEGERGVERERERKRGGGGERERERENIQEYRYISWYRSRHI
jgi:hypothetical protein